MNIAIFASGAGTNAKNIIEKLKNEKIFVKLILTNNPEAGVIKIATDHNIRVQITSTDFISQEKEVLDLLSTLGIDLIVLAGFLKKIPALIIKNFKKRIINIHPALLPKYGGKGMYGPRVHEAVIKNKDAFTGITIHFVNEFYDEGEIILQKKVDVSLQDNAGTIAQKVHELEYIYYPEVIKGLFTNKK
ncbi:MAG: phosphoribosylglycinamide formyltransferase [Saprospiraceae bacterium]|nr:phosphoribosylglycinamide formyltransferase [Saprospiraceae bacterium]